MLLVPDPLDPNFLDFGDDYEYRIYGDEKCRTWAIVDREDYELFCRYAWCVKTCKRNKSYLRRAVAIWENKKLIKTVSLYLHIEIQKRVCPPPSRFHVKVDHRNGNSWDCRRKNLRWATNAMNAKNVFGSHPHDLVEG